MLGQEQVFDSVQPGLYAVKPGINPLLECREVILRGCGREAFVDHDGYSLLTAFSMAASTSCVVAGMFPMVFIGLWFIHWWGSSPYIVKHTHGQRGVKQLSL